MNKLENESCENCGEKIVFNSKYYTHGTTVRWEGDNGVICRPTDYSKLLTNATPKK
jgi:hypothetical protein